MPIYLISEEAIKERKLSAYEREAWMRILQIRRNTWILTESAMMNYKLNLIDEGLLWPIRSVVDRIVDQIDNSLSDIFYGR